MIFLHRDGTITELGSYVELKKFSPLQEVYKYFAGVLQNPLVGKYFDINCPIGF